MSTLLITRCDRSPLLQAIHPAFRPTPQPVDGSVEPWRSPTRRALLLPLLPLVLPLRDHVPQPPTPQRSPTLRITVPLVTRHLFGALPRSSPLPWHPDRVQGRLQLRAVVPLSPGQHDRQRSPAPVECEVQLGGEAAAAPPEGFVAARWIAPPFSPLRPRLGPECGGRPRRADGRAPRCCPPRRPATQGGLPGLPAPGGLGGSVPRPPHGASGRGGRNRSARGHTAGEYPARGPRCAAARGSR
jgi:hypothetical protein